jgi:DNA-binding PadR family transcriptional regulator
VTVRIPWPTPREIAILDQLVERDKYGLELVASSTGAVTRTAVYVLLGRMAVKGLVEFVREEPAPPGETGPPRRIFRATAIGRQLHAAAVAVLRTLERPACPEEAR